MTAKKVCRITTGAARYCVPHGVRSSGISVKRKM